MAGRDFQGREKKKPKKDVKTKSIAPSFETPRPEVEVIRKGKKPQETEEQEIRNGQIILSVSIFNKTIEKQTGDWQAGLD